MYMYSVCQPVVKKSSVVKWNFKALRSDCDLMNIHSPTDYYTHAHTVEAIELSNVVTVVKSLGHRLFSVSKLC